MKTLLIILLTSFTANAQLSSIIISGDTIYNVNPLTNIKTQLTKLGASAATIALIDGKQNVLVSGDNIKTINGISLLGSENIITPSGNSITILANDATNNNAVANTLQDVGLSFDVVAGNTYKFKFFIVYTSAAATTGSRWVINGPATTFLDYYSNYTLTAISITNNQGLATYNVPAASNASSLTGSNIAIIEGIIKPSATGTVLCRFASEILSSAIVAKGGRSYVEFKQIN